MVRVVGVVKETQLAAPPLGLLSIHRLCEFVHFAHARFGSQQVRTEQRGIDLSQPAHRRRLRRRRFVFVVRRRFIAFGLVIDKGEFLDCFLLRILFVRFNENLGLSAQERNTMGRNKNALATRVNLKRNLGPQRHLPKGEIHP